MKSQAKDEELYFAQTENRQLKDTITALREALEKQKIECEERVQKVTASLNDEIAQLKSTVFALREELEANTVRYEEKVQQMERDAHNEKKQLRQMITTLRYTLESRNGKKRTEKSPGRRKTRG